MIQLIFEWIYENAMAIFISSFISFLLSKKYFDKANRENVLMTVIFPVVQILDSLNYSKRNYEKLYEIKSNYAIRYLHKNERNKLMILISTYKDVCKYDKAMVETDCIMSYYEYKLKKNGINPKPCAITDDEGEFVADDYPPDYHYLANQIYDIVSSGEFQMSPNDCTNNIVNVIDYYTKELYSDKKILLFDDYEITEVIKQSNVTKQWDERFNAVKKSRQDFLDLSVSKKVLQILNYSKSK